MEPRQKWIVFGLFVAILVANVTVYVVFNTDLGRREAAPRIEPSEFRGKPNTERDHAQALISRRADAPLREDGSESSIPAIKNARSLIAGSPEAEGGSAGSAEGAEAPMVDGDAAILSETTLPVERVEGPGMSAETDDYETPEEIVRFAREAGNRFDPAQGIAAIESALATSNALYAATEVYHALGTLRLRSEPPDPAGALEAFRAARDAPGGNAVYQEAVLAETHVLANEGRIEEALALTEAALRERPGVCAARVQVHLVRARLLAEHQEFAQAERAYRQAIEESLGLPGAGEDAQAHLYRQGCLNLARLFRETGEPDKATLVLNEMKEQLGADD